MFGVSERAGQEGRPVRGMQVNSSPVLLVSAGMGEPSTGEEAWVQRVAGSEAWEAGWG